MKWWPFEKRQEDADDDPVVRALLAEQGRIVATATAALETAAGWWARALATAEVTPPAVGQALTAPVLARIGRELCINGEALFVLEADRRTGLALRPCARPDITGGPDEDGWRYRVDLPGPTRTATVSRPSTDVLHIRYSVNRATPWRGQSPLAACPATAQLAKTLEAQLQREFQGPTGTIVFAGGAGEGDEQDAESLKKHYRELDGGVVLGTVPRDAAGGFGGVQQTPATERIGPRPPQVISELRETVAHSVFMACGISPGLAHAENAGSARESYRQFATATIGPVAALVEAELRRKIDPSASLNLKRLRAADIAGRSRAYRQLVEANMEPAKAAELTGLEG